MKMPIVDDHPFLRTGLVTLLHQTADDATILQAGKAVDAFEMVAQVADLDIIMLDLMLPDISGFEALEVFARLRPEVPVVVLSSSEDPHETRRALASGALGYVPKSASPRLSSAAIDLVMAGEVYVASLMLNQGNPAKHVLQGKIVETTRPMLAERQFEVLRLISEGHSNKNIASVSEKTVKAHVTAIFRLLDVQNRTRAAAVAREVGPFWARRAR